jgi:hypothetical protein
VAPEGAAFVESVRIKRADIVGRRRAARDAVINWLYERVAAGVNMPNIEDFWLTTKALYYGQHFATHEVDQATLWLRDEGYVTGSAAMGAGLIRMNITAKGDNVVESGRSVNDAAQPEPAIGGIFISGSHNVVQSGSPGATQRVTTTTTDHRQQTIQFADLLEQSLPVLGLPPDTSGLPAELRSAAHQDDPGILMTVLQKANCFSITPGSPTRTSRTATCSS